MRCSAISCFRSCWTSGYRSHDGTTIGRYVVAALLMMVTLSGCEGCSAFTLSSDAAE